MKKLIGSSVRAFVLALTILLSGCYYDKEEILYPQSANCTVSDTPSYGVNVVPLLNNRCNSCHGGNSPSGGIDLTTYSDVMKYVNNGRLMGSINHMSGYSAMPKNSSKLKGCEIDMIQKWIDTGATNN